MIRSKPPFRSPRTALLAGIAVLVAAAGMSLLIADPNALERFGLGIEVVAPPPQPAAEGGDILVVQPSVLPPEEIVTVQPAPFETE